MIIQLFQLQAERIRKLQSTASEKAAGGGVDAASCRIVWYVMTSPMTDADTREYFKEKVRKNTQCSPCSGYNIEHKTQLCIE